ncbi:MAG: tyrosine phosphatase family protein [Hyphomonadaceae bacterium]
MSPLSRVPDVIRAHRPDRIVSLLDPQSRFPDCAALGVERHLRVGVHDVSEIFEHFVSPNEAHVQDVLRFVEDWDRGAPMLVHCYAGISRSTATAFTIACALNPKQNEEEIAWALRRASHTAWPNSRIVALADAELGRGGRMIRAIAEIGDGRLWEDVGEADVFSIPSRFGAPNEAA